MPNTCDYSMRVVGKKENIEEFIKIMKATYNYFEKEFSNDLHFFRIFEAIEDQIEELDNRSYATTINGTCAWCVSSCMFDNEPKSYYQLAKQEYSDDFRGTLVPIESKRLGLDIEIFSEDGLTFQEHYIVKQGVIETEDCVDWHEYYIGDFSSKEEAEKSLNIKITDEEWEDRSHSICRGGFEWDFLI